MTFPDFFLLAVYLLALPAVIWSCRRRGGGLREYFLAGRSAGALPVGLSVMVTTFTAVNFLALPGEVFQHGLYVLPSLPVFFLAAWPVSRWWLPLIRRTGAVSVYALLEERFDFSVRLLCSGIFLLWRLTWMAAILYVTAKVTALLSGLDFRVLVLLCGTAALAAAAGGMRAVLWTDVLQFFILFGAIAAGLFLAFSAGNSAIGLADSGSLRPFLPPDFHFLSFDPGARFTLWSCLLGSMVIFLTRFGADQMVVQRFLSAGSLAAARRGLWLNGFASFLTLGLLVIFGLALAVFARRTGLPPETPPIPAVITLLRTFPRGAVGLFTAALLAATMSSVSSGLNSCVAALTADFRRRRRLTLPPFLLTCLLAVPVIAAAGTLFPVLHRMQTLFEILSRIVNAMGTPLLAVMICAFLKRRPLAPAVFAGTLTGFIITLVIGFTIKELSLHYYAVVSLLVTAVAVAVAQALYLLRRRG